MIRILVKQQMDFNPEAPKFYEELSGSYTDAKPTVGLVGGSLFLETDSRTMYTFDEKTETWETLFVFGGGS